MQKNNNKAIVKVIQEFVESWNSITVNVASCIATIVRLANSKLNNEKKLINADLNNSATDLNSSKDITMSITFDDAFDQYILHSLYLP
jgi:hypothetical protein